MNPEEDGYYWVKYEGVWYVGKFEAIRTSWNFPTDTMYSCDFEEIGDRIDIPNWRETLEESPR